MGGGGSAIPMAPQSNQVVRTPLQSMFPETFNGDIPFRSANAVARMCPQATRPGEMECDALMRTDLQGMGSDSGGPTQGYGANDLQSAYKTPSSSGGKGITVAIVDAYGYKTASADLAKYRAFYKLPPCTTSNGCLKVVGETGGKPPSATNPGWNAEAALDLDMVSAMCPNCKLVLLLANAPNGQDLYTAVKTAATKMHANVISNSYGGSEAESTDTTYFGTKGVVYVASSGDQGGGTKGGGGPQQPCSLPQVVCVGGTHLTKTSGGRGWSEVVWNDLKLICNGGGRCGAAGSGCSKLVAKPGWQNDNGCKMRSESDVSASAAVSAPVAIYIGVYGGWNAFGGTSVSAPLLAGMFALAGNTSTAGPQTIWGKRGTSSLNDVTSGTNILTSITGPCASSVKYICVAGKGYDGPTGWGSPNGVGAL